MLIGLNGKWKLKTEKSTKFRDKRKDKCMNKSKNNFKSNKNSKNILDKFNFVIYWSNIYKILNKIGIKPTKPTKTYQSNKLISELN